MEFPKLISTFIPLCRHVLLLAAKNDTFNLFPPTAQRKISPSPRYPDTASAITTLHSRLHFKTPSSRKSPHWMWQRILIPESLNFHPPSLTLESNPCVCQTSATPENDWPHSLPAQLANGQRQTQQWARKVIFLRWRAGCFFCFCYFEVCIWCPGAISFMYLKASYPRFLPWYNTSHLV